MAHGFTAFLALAALLIITPGPDMALVTKSALLYAKALGARVTASARSDKHATLRELGADEVLDYTSVSITDVVRDADVVVDPVGGDGTAALGSSSSPSRTGTIAGFSRIFAI